MFKLFIVYILTVFVMAPIIALFILLLVKLTGRDD
jgi:hypothetical protein